MAKRRTNDPEYPGRSDARYTSSVEDEPGGRPVHTAENAIGGAIIGGVPGALTGGPVGAVVGAAAGAAVGVATAESPDADDETGAAGDVANVENMGRRVKRDYEGHIYEEVSLADAGPGRNRKQI